MTRKHNVLWKSVVSYFKTETDLTADRASVSSNLRSAEVEKIAMLSWTEGSKPAAFSIRGF